MCLFCEFYFICFKFVSLCSLWENAFIIEPTIFPMPLARIIIQCDYPQSMIVHFDNLVA